MIEEVNEDVCLKGCTACVDFCPTDVLRINPTNGKAYIKYVSDCITCFICEIECPVGAIRVSPLRRQVRHTFPVFTQLRRNRSTVGDQL